MAAVSCGTRSSSTCDNEADPVFAKQWVLRQNQLFISGTPWIRIHPEGGSGRGSGRGLFTYTCEYSRVLGGESCAWTSRRSATRQSPNFASIRNDDSGQKLPLLLPKAKSQPTSSRCPWRPPSERGTSGAISCIVLGRSNHVCPRPSNIWTS